MATPGGHLEPEGTALAGVAVRKLTDETGISAEGDRRWLSLPHDVHTILENIAKWACPAAAL
ncbi:hypothetical protein ACIQOV_06390 [Kitasatospora sp. NPDC091257]|uniref:hypothetical protein n=1 Tax=Kitasatospora sp. NPDC091257 TaxID=3364084 RepID=UPI00382022A2